MCGDVTLIALPIVAEEQGKLDPKRPSYVQNARGEQEVENDVPTLGRAAGAETV